MKAIYSMLAACFVVGLIGSRSGAQEKQEPITAEKMQGTWVVTKVKSPDPDAKILMKAVLDLKKDGKGTVAIALPGVPPTPTPMNWSVEKNTLTMELHFGGGTHEFQIRSLTADQFIAGDPEGKETIEFTRKKAK